MSIKYIIPGDPVPLARIRFSRKHIYDEQSKLKFFLSTVLKQQHGDRALYKGALAMEITFFMPMPKKASQRIIGKPHIHKPDTDNMVKLICDICSKDILYHDDCTVYHLNCMKIYDPEPRTEFFIYEEPEGRLRL